MVNDLSKVAKVIKEMEKIYPQYKEKDNKNNNDNYKYSYYRICNNVGINNFNIQS